MTENEKQIIIKVKNMTLGWMRYYSIIYIIWRLWAWFILLFIFFPVAHKRKWKKCENSSGRVIIFFKSDFSLFGSFKIQMTFQTLILTELESNLRAPRSLLLERLKYRHVVHNVSCLLYNIKLVTKCAKK